MGFIKEFKEFAMRGNLIDMAVAVVIGGAFGKVVSAFVDGIVMPLIGKLSSGQDFSNIKWILQHEIKEGDKIIEPEVAVRIGDFMTTILDFIIVAFAVFLIIKVINTLKRKEEAKPTPPAAPSREEILLTEIRDLLKSKQ